MNIDRLNIRLNGEMNMEVLIGSGIAISAIYAVMKWNHSDKEKIQKTFKNINYCIRDKYPRLIKTHRHEDFTTYTYSVPYGLVDTDKLDVLEKVLNRPIQVSFTDTKLHIKVYKNKLPTRIDYDWKKTEGWTVPIGKSFSENVLHDFDKIPHMTIAGMTRQGKTVLLKLLFAHLINNNPDDVEFYIIDLKGGLEFNRYRNLKQVKVIADDVKSAEKTLKQVLHDVKHDMTYFKENYYTNILDTDIKKRKFIIVDEGAELDPPAHLSKDEKRPYRYCQHVLSEIARIAGALGYRLIFATQYPTSDTLPRQIKQNADAKISFRLPTELASRVAIDENGAERLTVVGRAIYRSADKCITQVPYVSDEDIIRRFEKYANSSDEKENTTRRTDTIKFG